MYFSTVHNYCLAFVYKNHILMYALFIIHIIISVMMPLYTSSNTDVILHFFYLLDFTYRTWQVRYDNIKYIQYIRCKQFYRMTEGF